MTGLDVSAVSASLTGRTANTISGESDDSALLPIDLLKAYYDLGEKRLKRWIAAGKLVHKATEKAKSGQTRHLFDCRDVERLIKEAAGGGDCSHLASRFALNCNGLGFVPLHVLHHIMTSPGILFRRHNELAVDADMAYACIRLIQTCNVPFMYYLSGQTPDNADPSSFEAKLASLVGAPNGLQYRNAEDSGLDVEALDNYVKFEHWFDTYQKVFLREGDLWRNLKDGRTPAYLDRLNCANIPDWAKEPVWPIDQEEATKQRIKLIESQAQASPELAAELDAIKAGLRLLSPEPVATPVDAQPSSDRLFPQGFIDPVVDEEITGFAERLAARLATPGSSSASEGLAKLREWEERQQLGYPDHHADRLDALEAERRDKHRTPEFKMAKSYCYAIWRLMHHDKIRAIRENTNLANGTYTPEKLPKAVVARVFGASC